MLVYTSNQVCVTTMFSVVYFVVFHRFFNYLRSPLEIIGRLSSIIFIPRTHDIYVGTLGGRMFDKIQDETLLVDCKSAVVAEKQSTARVLEYLAEIDKRRLWLKEGYSSLYDFCLRYLNYSEGETHRRIQACRLSSKVEQVKPLLESGAVSLTSLSLLSPVLTKENAMEILPKITHQPTRQVEKVIREHFPEVKWKPEVLKVELGEELILWDEAKLLASEKDSAQLLKRVLRDFLRERKTRSTEVKRQLATSLNISRELMISHMCSALRVVASGAFLFQERNVTRSKPIKEAISSIEYLNLKRTETRFFSPEHVELFSIRFCKVGSIYS